MPEVTTARRIRPAAGATQRTTSALVTSVEPSTVPEHVVPLRILRVHSSVECSSIPAIESGLESRAKRRTTRKPWIPSTRISPRVDHAGSCIHQTGSALAR